MKIKGFNVKEQKCYDILSDGEVHDIREMKAKFMKLAESDPQAQSMVRNGIRRLIRDGWVEKTAYGTYHLTADGRRWVKAGKDTTRSFGVKRGRKPMSEEDKAAAAKKRAKIHKETKAEPKKKEAKVAKKDKVEKKATPKKKTGVMAKAVLKEAANKKKDAPKKEAKKADGKNNGVSKVEMKKKSEVVKKKAMAAKQRVAKQVAKDKVEEIKEKVKDQEPETSAE